MAGTNCPAPCRDSLCPAWPFSSSRFRQSSSPAPGRPARQPWCSNRRASHREPISPWTTWTSWRARPRAGGARCQRRGTADARRGPAIPGPALGGQAGNRPALHAGPVLLLTGSANLLLMRWVSESLAGRAAYLTLWLLTRREQLGLGTPLVRSGRACWQPLIATVPAVLSAETAPEEDWRALARRGGYPDPRPRVGRCRGAVRLVRRLCQNLPRTRSAGDLGGGVAGGCSATDAGDSACGSAACSI